MTKTLICIAPDGEYVGEGRFPNTEAAWDHSSDMGSRWFFYPIHVVLGAKGKRIVDVPDDMGRGWIGKSLKSLQTDIKSNEEEICNWLNGDAPCPIYYHGV